jgi:DNA-binding IclR family transcriptional regulator
LTEAQIRDTIFHNMKHISTIPQGQKNQLADSYPGAQAIARAVAVLKAFDDRHPEWGLSDLSEHVGLNKTTTHRILAALESEGLIARNPISGGYRLGLELVALGGAALRATELHSIARPEMERLAHESEAAVSLEVLNRGQTLVLDEVTNRGPAGAPRDMGGRLPLHATSTGKLLLAYRSQDEVRRLLQRPLTPLTARTITDPTQLAQALTQIRAQGYAVAREELEIGFVAVAAPLHDHSGAVVAAISIGGPLLTMTEERLPALVASLQITARAISRQLGYRPG